MYQYPSLLTIIKLRSLFVVPLPPPPPPPPPVQRRWPASVSAWSSRRGAVPQCDAALAGRDISGSLLHLQDGHWKHAEERKLATTTTTTAAAVQLSLAVLILHTSVQLVYIYIWYNYIVRRYIHVCLCIIGTNIYVHVLGSEFPSKKSATFIYTSVA